jgi:hypothetical protein
MPATTDDPIATAAEAIGLKRRVIEPAAATATAEAHAPAVIRETVDDWQNRVESAAAYAEPYRTRDELVAYLRDLGIDITARNLIFWHEQHVLPHPTKRPVGRTRKAYYPDWFAGLVVDLRKRQEDGWSLDQIRDWLPWHFAQLYESPLSQREQQKIARKELDTQAQRLEGALRERARLFERAHNVRVLRGDVIFYDADGRRLPESFDLTVGGPS